MQFSGNIKLLDDVLRIVQARLPLGWHLRQIARDGTSGSDIELIYPGQAGVSFKAEIRAALDPRGVIQLKAGMASETKGAAGSRPVLVISRYLAPATRQKLVEAGFNFADLTGNVRIVLASPAIFIELSGADRSPFREDRKSRTLRGPKVGRIVRALVDFAETPGVRELAVRAGVDAGYLSRVLTLLEREALIDRGHRGCVVRLDWPGLLRRWASDAPLESRGEVMMFIDPRGLDSVVTKLATSGTRYAVTGSLAAGRVSQVAPARLAMIYVDDIDAASGFLGLRPAEAGANVVLVRPVDDVVYERSFVADGVRYAAVSQVAADLLTSPGRGPAEAEELLNWMEANQKVWRG
ncbi:hypothetical protein KBA39_05545 [Myxococcota bacterium]|nr:hypothetical protein [Myxococcota bacterium]